jgi:hypothetical protein
LWEVVSPVTPATDSGWVNANSEVMPFQNHIFEHSKPSVCGTQNQRLATSTRIRFLGNPLRFAKGNRLIRLGEYCSQFRAFAE